MLAGLLATCYLLLATCYLLLATCITCMTSFVVASKGNSGEEVEVDGVSTATLSKTGVRVLAARDANCGGLKAVVVDGEKKPSIRPSGTKSGLRTNSAFLWESSAP